MAHDGYEHLADIIDLAGKKDKHFVYHSGVDKMYLHKVHEGLFDPEKYVQAKGSLFDF